MRVSHRYAWQDNDMQGEIPRREIPDVDSTVDTPTDLTAQSRSSVFKVGFSFFATGCFLSFTIPAHASWNSSWRSQFFEEGICCSTSLSCVTCFFSSFTSFRSWIDDVELVGPRALSAASICRSKPLRKLNKLGMQH